MPKILVLMATFNGEKFIKEQIDSIFNQRGNFEITLLVHDDGSDDDTLDILNHYKVKIIKRNNKKRLGPSRSFGELISFSIRNRSFDYIMFSDQDDIWCEDKILKSYNAILSEEKLNPYLPILVHADLLLVDHRNHVICNSFLKMNSINPKKNNLNNLLVQNIVTGSTIMINKNLAKNIGSVPSNAIMHDWWIALVASLVGKIIFIPEVLVRYRQHGNNYYGGLSYVKKSIKKKAEDIKQEFLSCINQAREFYNLYGSLMTDKQEKLINNFINIKKKNNLTMLYNLFLFDIQKHTFKKNILFIYSLFKR